MTSEPLVVVVSTFTGTASISFVSGFPLATMSARVVDGVGVVDGLGVVVGRLVVVRVFVVVGLGRFVVVFVGFVVILNGLVVVLLGTGFVYFVGFVVDRVGFGLVTDGFVDVPSVVVGLFVGFTATETFCTDWNVVSFTGAAVVVVLGFFFAVVVGSFSVVFVVTTGLAVVVFVTLKGGSLAGIIAKSILLSTIS